MAVPVVPENRALLALVLIALVAVGAALHFAAIAFLPLVAALLLCLLFWPLRQLLVRVMPRWIAALVCCLIMLVAILGVGGWGWYAGDKAFNRFQDSRQAYVDQYQSMRSWLTSWGVPETMVPNVMSETDGSSDGASREDGGTSGDPDQEQQDAGDADRTESDQDELADESGSEPRVRDESAGDAHANETAEEKPQQNNDMRERLTRLVVGGMRTVLGAFVAILLTVFLVYLALIEGDRWAAWAKRHWQPGFYSTVSELVHTWSRQTRRHFFAKTISGIISGTMTGLWLWFMGVPMPLVWAILTLLLNYIPNIGAFISGAPPTLLAIVELGWTEAIIVAVGLWIIEALVGNLIDPWLAGDFLKLSTFVVLASLVLWGWLWGIAGAVMSPVLTAGLWAAWQRREALLGNGRHITKKPPGA